MSPEGEPTTSLLKPADDDPTLPASLRRSHPAGSGSPVARLAEGRAPEPIEPPRPRRPRLSAATAQAEVEALLASDPDAAAALLTRYVDRLATSTSFLLWASSAFSRLAQLHPRTACRIAR